MDLKPTNGGQGPPPLPRDLASLVRERLVPRTGLPFGPIWIQGVSVGEVEVASTLARALSERRPGVPLLLTSTTPAGVALLARRFPAGEGEVSTRPFPLDLPPSVRRFFRAVGPRLLVLVETELWPAILGEARRRSVPVLLVSARLSARSVARLRRVRPLLRRPFAAISRVLARTEDDARRFREIGVEPSKVEVGGDLKFDRTEPGAPEFGERVLSLAAGREILVAGSLAAEEVPLVAEAVSILAREGRAPFLLAAPRRPETWDGAALALESRGLRVERRSAGAEPGRQADAFLLDSVGELASAYRLGTVALLGGTFAPKGGHNVLEPLLCGLPVVVGPSTANIRQAVQAASGAVFPATDARSAAEALARLLSDPAERERAAAAARGLFSSSRGAAGRAADAALALFDASAPAAAEGGGPG